MRRGFGKIAVLAVSVLFPSGCAEIGDFSVWSVDKIGKVMMVPLTAYEGVLATGFGVVWGRPKLVKKGLEMMGSAAVDVVSAPVYMVANPLVSKDRIMHIHGNWCGPGVPPADRSSDPKPAGLLDSLCKRHDLCYERAEKSKGSTAQCDLKLAGGLRAKMMEFNSEEYWASLKVRSFYGLSALLLP